MGGNEYKIQKQVPYLRRYTRALVGDAILADELVENCLVCAAKLLPLLHNGVDIKVWLFSIMHSLLADFIKSHNDELEEQSLILDFKSSDVDPILSEKVDDSNYFSALAALDLDEREAFLLVSLEGLSYQQVCEVTGTTEGKLLLDLDSARKQLGVMLYGTGEAEETVVGY